MATHSKTEARPIAERIEKARREGRTQQALELAKQLAKYEPTPEHQQLLRSVIFERGCQLLKDGKDRDAIVVFQNALTLEAPPEFCAAVAAKLAQAGDVAASLSLFTQLPDCPERAKAFAQAVDAALVKGTAGRSLVPTDLHAGFDAILAAFGFVEKGHDDAARDALQAIGLSSPLLEWKVMLRGLIAYHQNDDARALDNWQRLDPERQLWRLVAPFRSQIDPGFRDSQPAATKTRLQALVERAGPFGEIAALRGIAKHMGSWDDPATVRSAFKGAREFIRMYGDKNPQIVEQLSLVFYRKIAEDGNEADLEVFRNTFVPPADDPKLFRLHGISAEAAREMPYAVDGWLDYANDLPNLPDRFPGDTGLLARALVWERLAPLVKEVSLDYKLPKHIPPADECYRKSIALVPGRLGPHQLLLRALIADPKKKKQATAAAKQLVADFPGDAETWEFLGDTFLKEKKAPSAIDAFRTALKANPMHRSLRGKLADALSAQGLKLAASAAKAGPKPEKYRPVFEEAIRFTEGNLIARLAAWASIEFRHDRADFARELIAKAETQPHSRVALPLAMHAAAQSDKKTPDAIREEHQTRWSQTLTQKPTPDEVLVALDSLVLFDTKLLRGKKELVDSILPKLSNRPLEAFGEAQLLKLGRALSNLKLKPSARKIVEHAARRFPKNPAFQLLLCDIILSGPGAGYTWIAVEALGQARKLALNLPREQQEEVLKEITRREGNVKMPPKFGLNILDMLGGFGGGFEDDDDPW